MKNKICLLLFLCAGVVSLRGARPVCIVHLTDPQLGFYSMNSDYSRERAQVVELIGAINRWHPDCVVISGDLVNNLRDTLQLAGFDSLCRMVDRRIPLLLLPGNHDLGNDASPEQVDRYVARYGADRWVWHKGPCRMIGINTTELKAGSADREAAQRAWLERALQRGRHSRCLIVVGHHPFFVHRVDEAVNYDNLREPLRTTYLELLKRYGVDCVLTGHIHRCAEAQVAGIQFWSTAAAGRTFGHELPGLRVLKIAKDGTFESAYYEIGHLPKQINE